MHHNGGGSEDDALLFNVTIANDGGGDGAEVDDAGASYGPFRLVLAVTDRLRPMLLVTRNVTVAAGSSAIINGSSLRAILPSAVDDDDGGDAAAARVRFLVTRLPDVGRLLVDGELLPTSGGATAHFSLAQLAGNRVIFTTAAAAAAATNDGDNDRRQLAPLERTAAPPSAPVSVTLRVCTQRSCSDEARLTIRVEIENRQGKNR